MQLHQKKFVNSSSKVKDSEVKHAIDIDIIESNEGLVLLFDLPGFSISDIKMFVSHDGILKVNASREVSFSPLESALLTERLVGGFYKEVVLPKGLNFEKPESTFENGVLRLFIAKL